MADWLIITILLLSSQLISLGLGDEDPCSNYKLLSDDGGRSINCERYHPNSHDRFIDEGWRRVKLESTGEDLTMPTQSVPNGRCGSHSNVWLNGTHPTVEDGIVDRIGCLSMFSSKCYKKYPIQIKNCKGYMVYNLKRTLGSDERYCFGDSPHCYPQTTTIPPSTTWVYKEDHGRKNFGYEAQRDLPESVEKKRTVSNIPGMTLLSSSRSIRNKIKGANKRKPARNVTIKKLEKRLEKARRKMEQLKRDLSNLEAKEEVLLVEHGKLVSQQSIMFANKLNVSESLNFSKALTNKLKDLKIVERKKNKCRKKISKKTKSIDKIKNLKDEKISPI